MPGPGDLIVEPMRSEAMIYEGTVETDHCPERPKRTKRRSRGRSPEASVGLS
jgi:hypothetical protein